MAVVQDNKFQSFGEHSNIALIENSECDLFVVNAVTLDIESVSLGLIRRSGYSKKELLSMRFDDFNFEFGKEDLKKDLKPLYDDLKSSIIVDVAQKNKDGSITYAIGCVRKNLTQETPQLLFSLQPKSVN